MCEKSFALDDTRVRNHYLLIGRYRGLPYSYCNINYIISSLLHIYPIEIYAKHIFYVI